MAQDQQPSDWSAAASHSWHRQNRCCQYAFVVRVGHTIERHILHEYVHIAKPGAACFTRMRTGVLAFSMGSKASGPICSDTVCQATIVLPVTNTFNASLGTACVRLDAVDSAPNTLLASTAGVSTSAAASGAVTCTSSSFGKVVVVQYELPMASVPPESPSPSPLPSPSPSPEVATEVPPSPSPQLGTQPATTAYTISNVTVAEQDKGQPLAFEFRCGAGKKTHATGTYSFCICLYELTDLVICNRLQARASCRCTVAWYTACL